MANRHGESNLKKGVKSHNTKKESAMISMGYEMGSYCAGKQR